MPSKNTIKEYECPAFYHVYNRGAGGQAIFRDDIDRKKFLTLLERHLSPTYTDENEDNYQKFDVELIAYCLMGNHFHLLLYQEHDAFEISRFMRSISTAYSMYFNKKYKGQGHVFQSIFRASHISDESYLLHITRYIHLNPEPYKTYRWSSLPHYIGKDTSNWIHPERVNTIKPDEYLQFLQDYTDRRLILKEIKDQLAA